MAGGARICLGQIGAAHGVRGEVRLHSFTAKPAAIADYGPLETEDGRVFEIASLRPAKNHFVARLLGIVDRTAAERLANLKLYVPRERLPALSAADEFYHSDLIGLTAVDPAGNKLGIVVAIHNFGAGDLIEVRPQAGDRTQFVLFDQTNVPAVDIAAGCLVVDAASAFAADGSDAAPSRASGTSKNQPLTPTAAGSRRRRSILPRKGRG